MFQSRPILNQIMTNAKKILITTESHEVFILRLGNRERAFGHCADCGHEVEMLTLDQAVSESRLRTSVLVQMAETGKLHAVETRDGHLIVCDESIRGLYGVVKGEKLQ